MNQTIVVPMPAEVCPGDFGPINDCKLSQIAPGRFEILRGGGDPVATFDSPNPDWPRWAATEQLFRLTAEDGWLIFEPTISLQVVYSVSAAARAEAVDEIAGWLEE